MITVKDIATKAGVGVGTVSRLLKGNGYVSREKREQIQRAMDELGYVPKKSTEDKAVKVNKPPLVGVVVPHVAHPFFSNMLMHVEYELNARGYYSLVINEENIMERQYDALNLLDEGKISGIINMASMPYEFEGRKGRPIVAMDREWGADVPMVRSDHAMGAQLVAEAFLKAGCRKVVQFIGGKNINVAANLRHRELKRIMEENGGEVLNIMTEWDSLNYEYNTEMIFRYREILKMADGCMTNDLGAVCCQNYMQSIGRKIPEDFKVIAYDGTGIVHLGVPALPAVYQDTPALSQKVVEVLMDMINGKEPEKMLYEVPVYYK